MPRARPAPKRPRRRRAERSAAQVRWRGLNRQAPERKGTGVCSSLESFQEKFLRKTRENPAVPVALQLQKSKPKARGSLGPDVPLPTCCVPSSGCLGTAAALTYGLYCFHSDQSQRSQLMMRTRIAAWGFTVAAILLGLATSALKSRS